MLLLGMQILVLISFIYIVSQYNIKLISRLIYAYRSTKSSVLRLLALIFFVGTFIHELAHLLTAEALLVRTEDLNLIPEIKGEKSFKLGGVKIEKTDPLRRILIGVAPVFIGLIIIWIASGLLVSVGSNWWYILLYVFLLFQIGHTMFSSRQDLQGALIGIFLFILLFILGYFLNDIIVLPLFVQARAAINQFWLDYLPVLVNGLTNTLIIILIFTVILFILALFKRKS